MILTVYYTNLLWSWIIHSIFWFYNGHIVLHYKANFVYSQLNLYVSIHWILNFKYILLLLCIHLISCWFLISALWLWPPKCDKYFNELKIVERLRKKFNALHDIYWYFFCQCKACSHDKHGLTPVFHDLYDFS